MNEKTKAILSEEGLEGIATDMARVEKWIMDAISEIERLHKENQELQQMCANQAGTLFDMHKTQEELVEALKWMMDILVVETETDVKAIDRAEAALAKARGESHD